MASLLFRAETCRRPVTVPSADVEDESSAYHGEGGAGSIFCNNLGSTDQYGFSREGTVAYAISQELPAPGDQLLEIGRTYELSFWLGYAIPWDGSAPFPTLSPNDMPFIKANLGGTVISASKQPCDVNVEGQYQANNEQWVKQGPSYVQPTTVPGALRFIIEMRGFMVQLGFDAVDLHTTPA